MVTPSRSGSVLTNSGRVEAFSDGVLAIAITLLVLDLHAPEAGDRGSFGHVLLHEGTVYGAYLAAFATIGVIWVNHHQLFTRVRQVDTPLLWFNLLLLLATSVLPFPTSVLANALQSGDRGDRQGAVALFAIVSGLMGVSWYLIYRHLDRHPELLEGHVRQGFFRAEMRRAEIGISLYSANALIGYGSPWAAAAITLLLPVFYGITSSGRPDPVDDSVPPAPA